MVWEQNNFLNRTSREQLILILGLAKPLLFAVYADFADRAKLTVRPIL